MNSKFLNALFNVGLLSLIAMSSASKAVAGDDSNRFDKWVRTTVGANNTGTYISSTSLTPFIVKADIEKLADSKLADGNSSKKVCDDDATNDDEVVDQDRDSHDYDNDWNYENETIDDYYNHENESPHDYDNDWGNDGR